MHAFAAAGAGFLIAVLWFDLMFDVQVRGHAGAVLPAGALDSIAAYYRRVTTQARPMNAVVPLAMFVTLASTASEFTLEPSNPGRTAASLALTVAAVALALSRTVRNAVVLGRQDTSPERQTALARSVFRDHLICLICMASVLSMQLSM
jgi:hypothetical protein